MGLMACAGPTGDRYQFQEYVKKNLSLYSFRNEVPLSTQAVAHWTRGKLAYFLRKSPYQTDILIGGYDEKKGPSLYFMDYLGSMHKLNKAAHGMCAMFVLGLMDRY